MSRTRACATAVAAAAVFSPALAMPIANADDPLGPIRFAVNGDRSRTSCPAYAYSGALEDAAQMYARSKPPHGGNFGFGYNGKTTVFYGVGDPEAVAINTAYRRGAGDMIGKCDYTEFGVGFLRDDDSSLDTVIILFGKPEEVVAPPVVPVVPAPVPCPAGSPTPTVPAGGTCASVPPLRNSVTMAVSGAGFGKINVALTNSADINASCVYTAKPASNPLGILPTITRTVAVPAKGSAVLDENSPAPFSTYHLAVSCTGTFDGNNVDLGHPTQDVSG